MIIEGGPYFRTIDVPAGSTKEVYLETISAHDPGSQCGYHSYTISLAASQNYDHVPWVTFSSNSQLRLEPPVDAEGTSFILMFDAEYFDD